MLLSQYLKKFGKCANYVYANREGNGNEASGMFLNLEVVVSFRILCKHVPKTNKRFALILLETPT
jgi:hypothetical protein